MIRYIAYNTIWALKDFNHRIESKGSDFVNVLDHKNEVSKLSLDEPFVYSLSDQGTYATLDDVFFKMYKVSEFPQIIYPNWLNFLANYEEPVVISQFIKPIEPTKALKGLRNRITNLSAKYLEKAEKGKIHTSDLEQAISDARNVEEEIVRGVEKLYAMSMYVKFSDYELSELNESSKSLKNIAYAKQLKIHPLSYKNKEGIECFLPNVTNSINEELALTSSNISSSLPFTTASLNDPDGIFYGITMGGSKVRFDRFSKNSKNFNGIIFATSGAGKSFAAKLEAYRSLFRGISVIVIDPEGEFKAMCDSVGGTTIDINPESSTKVNPFQFFSDENSKEAMRMHLGVIKGLLKIWLSKESYNRGIISKAVNDTYEKKGVLLEDPKTYAKEPPTVSDLIETFKASKEPIARRIAIELLEYSKKGELGDLYDNPSSSDIDFNAPMIVFSIQKVPDSEKQSAIFYLSNFIWQKTLSSRDRKILIIDEAHLLLKDESSANFMENVVRRGRKYNLGVISISQDVEDFLNSPQGSVIAKNAETALILSQKKSSIESLVKAFDLSSIEEDFITNLSKGQALFIKGNSHSHLQIFPTKHELTLFS